MSSQGAALISLSMPSQFRKFSVPSILATGLAAFALSACGGSDDSEVSELAKFAPADTPVFIEASVQPDSDLAANVDSITERLAGVNLGDLIKEGISSDSDSEIDFDADVKPWLGETAAAFVEVDPAELASGAAGGDGSVQDFNNLESAGSDEQKFGLVVQTTDAEAAQAFIDKQAETDSGATDGEYEGVNFKADPDDGTVIGIVEDHIVMGSTEAEFKAAVDASKGDNLSDTKAFSDLSGNAADGALATVFTSNEPFMDSMKQEGFDLGGLYSALGYDFEDTGNIVSLVPDENEIAIKGYTNAKSEMTSGDPSPVIETFPGNTVFAAGSGDVGENASKVMDALNKEGIPGMMKPGEIDKLIEETSGQIDVKGIIDSLETVAFFVNGDNPGNLGGALVATSSNIDPIETSLRGISSLIGLAGDADVKPLPGGVAGFRVRTSELPGRPVVIGVKDDRLVIGVGMKAAMNALNGGGQTLADSEAYKAADESTPEDGLDMFADPAGIATLIQAAGSGDPDAAQIADVISKFSYMAAGSSDGEGTFEFNMGLQE